MGQIANSCFKQNDVSCSAGFLFPRETCNHIKRRNHIGFYVIPSDCERRSSLSALVLPRPVVFLKISSELWWLASGQLADPTSPLRSPVPRRSTASFVPLGLAHTPQLGMGISMQCWGQQLECDWVWVENPWVISWVWCRAGFPIVCANILLSWCPQVTRWECVCSALGFPSSASSHFPVSRISVSGHITSKGQIRRNCTRV